MHAMVNLLCILVYFLFGHDCLFMNSKFIIRTLCYHPNVVQVYETDMYVQQRTWLYTLIISHT